MDLFTAIGFAAVAAVVSFSVRQFNAEAGRNIAIAASALILLSVIDRVSGVFSELNALAQSGGISPDVITLIFKAAGIAYLTRLTSSLCKDLGEDSLAVSCELIGRVLLVMLALPLIRTTAAALIGLINGDLW